MLGDRLILAIDEYKGLDEIRSIVQWYYGAIIETLPTVFGK